MEAEMSKPATLILFKDKEEQEGYKAFYEDVHKGMMPFYAMFKHYAKPEYEKWKKKKEKEAK
jgi:hypothetical protein